MDRSILADGAGQGLRSHDHFIAARAVVCAWDDAKNMQITKRTPQLTCEFAMVYCGEGRKVAGLVGAVQVGPVTLQLATSTPRGGTRPTTAQWTGKGQGKVILGEHD